MRTVIVFVCIIATFLDHCPTYLHLRLSNIQVDLVHSCVLVVGLLQLLHVNLEIRKKKKRKVMVMQGFRNNSKAISEEEVEEAE